jgi:hypothetical protein
MPYNMPNGLVNNISFGPATVFMKEWNATAACTPTADVGYITEDGVSIEMNNEVKNISQGNPRLTEYSFMQAQSVAIKFSNIQWNMQAFAFAMGAGATAYGATGSPTYGDKDVNDVILFRFGGDPINKSVAIHVKHAMAVSSNTISIYGWKCQSEGGYNIQMGQDEHAFEYTFNCIRDDKNWGKVKSLDRTSQLVSIVRQLTSTQVTNFAADGGPGGKP